MKTASITTLLSLLLATTNVNAFSPTNTFQTQHAALSLTSENQEPSDTSINRRSLLTQTTAAILAATSLTLPTIALADETPKTSTIVVAGATGQTGRRILERLASLPLTTVVGGVRNIDKATAALSESSTVVRGAMVQKVGSVDTAGVTLVKIDVVKDSVEEIASSLKGADGLVIATGFVPGNPLKMQDEAHKVDNVGTIRLIDAAKQAGVGKVVMVSSILTNGRNWGQEKSPGFVITNAFGQVLDEKIVAENYLRASGLDYTIVRPGGLKAKPPTGALKISGEDTLNSGEISRDLVADVCVASLSDGKAKNKVLEIIEDDGTPAKVFNGLNM